MTVRELILQLQAQDPERPVGFYDQDGDWARVESCQSETVHEDYYSGCWKTRPVDAVVLVWDWA